MAYRWPSCMIVHIKNHAVLRSNMVFMLCICNTMWPRYDSWAWCHMWVEFVFGSRPCSKGFSPGSLIFLPPGNQHFDQ